MKPIALVLLCLVLGSQGRVLQPAAKEALDIPVAIIKDELQPLIKEEQPKEPKLELEQEKQAEQVEQLEQLEQEAKTQLPLDEPELKTELPKIGEPQPEEQAQPEAEAQPILKAQPVEAAEEPAESVPAEPLVEQPQQVDDAVQPHIRQATQATPTQQSSTQQNFVQQLIQNSPIGQFLNQFNGQQQPQQQQQTVQADQTATPAPTVPGFLNPSAAITSAQNAVQNAAQSVVNTTTQAFQGIQQFATNLGTQFQNTLSGLTGQQQQSAQPTTARPPGPIQTFVNNVFGGGNNATAAAAPQPQQVGPLQGIINFLGGNRPQNAPPAVATVTEAPAKPAVDDKLEQTDDVAEQPAESENEVRSSAEATDDSFEEAVPVNEVIVVNDDASAQDPAAERVPSNSVEPEIEPEVAAAATEDGAVAL